MPASVPQSTVDEVFVGSRFAIELDNGITGEFSDASGFALEMGVTDKKVARLDGTISEVKLPGTGKFQDITLKRTLTTDKSFYNWINDIRNRMTGEYRTDGAMVLYDFTGAEAGRWTFTNVWPSKWSASDLDVGTDDPMVEEVTLSCNELKREK